jgi:exonuclease SbcC
MTSDDKFNHALKMFSDSDIEASTDRPDDASSTDSTNEETIVPFSVIKNDSSGEIKYVYHISDIHVRNESRHEEYQEVFQRVYDYLSNQINKSSIIVLTGDILHFKMLLSPEAIGLTSNFFRKLSAIMPVVLIPGNHDCNLANVKRMDALTPLVDDINNLKNFHYLKRSGVYQYQNILFGFTSVFENQLVKASSITSDMVSHIKYKNKYKIALYHGPVHGAMTDVGSRMNVSELTADHFDGYDYVMLGDIHKYQYMNKRKTIAYAGSLIQQSYGEKPDFHGILKWDLYLKESEFIPIKNDYGYYTVNIKNGLIDRMIDDTMGSNPRIRFNLDNTTNAEFQDCLDTLKLTHNVQEVLMDSVSIKSKATPSDTNSDHDLSDLSNQAITIRKYLSRLKCTESQIDKLITLHNKVYQKVLEVKKDQVLDPMHLKSAVQRWKILELKFSNMLSYGTDNIVDFRAYDANHIIGIMAPNRYGKSAVLDVILFCLFDKFTRGDRKDILNKNCDDMSCSLLFSIGSQMYLIKRHGVRTKASVKIDVDFTHLNAGNTSKTSKSLNGIDKNDTNSKIVEMIGTYNDYIATCFALQGKNSSFLDMTQLERKAYLNEILKLNLFEECYKYIKDKSKEGLGQLKLLEKKSDEKQYEMLCTGYSADKIKVKKLQLTLTNINKQIQLIDNYLVLNPMQSLPKYIELSEYKLNSMDKITQCIATLMHSLDNDDEKQLRKTANKLQLEYVSIGEQIDNIKSACAISELRDHIELQLKKLISIPSDLKGHDQVSKLKAKSFDLHCQIASLNVNCDHMPKMRARIEKLESAYKNISYSSHQYDSLVAKSLELEGKILCHVTAGRVLSDTRIHEMKLIIKCKNQSLNVFKQILSCSDNSTITSIVSNQIATITDKNSQWMKIIECSSNFSPSIDINRLSERYVECVDKLNVASNQLASYYHDLGIKKKLDKARSALDAMKTLQVLTSKVELIDQQIRMIEMYTDAIEGNTIINDRISDLKSQIKQIESKESLLVHKKEQVKKFLDDNRSQIKYANIVRRKHVKQLSLLKLYKMEFSFYDIEQKELSTFVNLKDDIVRTQRLIQNDIQQLTTKMIIDKNWAKQFIENSSSMCALRDKMELYRLYIQLMNQNGLPYEILKTYLPFIQTQINQILASIVDFTVEFALNTTATGSININIYYPNSKQYNVSLTSGFEKFIIGLALRMTLSKISLIAKPNFIVIDEGWSCFDAENLSNVGNVLNYLKTQYDHVIIISHLEEMKIQADYVITINKKDGFSHLNAKPWNVVLMSKSRFGTGNAANSRFKSKVNPSINPAAKSMTNLTTNLAAKPMTKPIVK